MKALSILVSGKICFNYSIEPFSDLLWQLTRLEQLGRAPPSDHSCEIWSEFNEQFQRRNVGLNSGTVKRSFPTPQDTVKHSTDNFKVVYVVFI